MKKVLFICSKNQRRSPTAEEYFRSQGYRTSSAGTRDDANNRVDMLDIQWADLIVVMEKKHRKYLLNHFPEITVEKEIRVLHIPDRYQYNDPKLIQIFSKLRI